MGVNDLFELAPVKDTRVYQSGVADLWNKKVPSFLPKIGDTTVIDGKQYGNMNKNFNEDSLEELSGRFNDKTQETPDSGDPYFYKLRNKETGEVKYGLAPNGLDERYQGQDMSMWDTEYNERRADAVDLESRIHGNKNMLKRRAVDYGLSKNKFGKGATEVYSKGLAEVEQLLDVEQTDILNSVKKPLEKEPEYKGIFSEAHRMIEDPSGTLVDAIMQIDDSTRGKSAGEVMEGLGKTGQDIAGGLMKGTGDLVGFASDVARNTSLAGLIGNATGLYDETKVEEDKVVKAISDKAIDIADDPNSATFAVSELLSPVPTAGTAKALTKTVEKVSPRLERANKIKQRKAERVLKQQKIQQDRLDKISARKKSIAEGSLKEDVQARSRKQTERVKEAEVQKSIEEAGKEPNPFAEPTPKKQVVKGESAKVREENYLNQKGQTGKNISEDELKEIKKPQGKSKELDNELPRLTDDEIKQIDEAKKADDTLGKTKQVKEVEQSKPKLEDLDEVDAFKKADAKTSEPKIKSFKPLPKEKDPIGAFDKSLDKTRTEKFKDFITAKPDAKSYRDTFSRRKAISQTEADAKEALFKEMKKTNNEFKRKERKEFQEGANRHILETDVHSLGKDIKSEADAVKFEKQHEDLMKIPNMEDYIEQSAKGVGVKSEQIGFDATPAEIASDLKLTDSAIPNIDKLITIRAMKQNKSWEFIDKYKDSKSFKLAMDVIGRNKERSDELFAKNPKQKIKGFAKEILDRADDRIKGQREGGTLPVEKEKAKIENDCGWASKQIPRLLNTVYYCLISEESWNFVKENKNPIIDFRRLHSLSIQKTKEYM